MRHFASMRLAVFGLALAVPTVAWSDPPETTKAPVRHGLFGRHHRHVCPNCQMKAQLRADALNAPPMGMIQSPPGSGMMMPAAPGAPCLACQAAAGAPVMIMDNGEAAGHAVISGAPVGHAMAGMTSPMAEPAPIGVVQAGFRPASMPSPMAAGPASAYPVPNQGGRGLLPGAPTPVRPQPANRPHILAHLFGLETGSISRARHERMKAEHARIRYDDSERAVGELPASMVYGPR
ncbi:MAG: hypothetical protein ABI353_02560 [Isosphaeraceae bacterium]